MHKFIIEIYNTRGVVANLQSVGRTYDPLKSAQKNVILYLNMLNCLKSKFNFGNDEVYKVNNILVLT